VKSLPRRQASNDLDFAGGVIVGLAIGTSFYWLVQLLLG
jgi:hypothetical protein